MLALVSAIVTPFAGFSGSPLDGEARTWRLGGRLHMESGFSLAVEGTRTEQCLAPPEHTLGLSGSLRFR